MNFWLLLLLHKLLQTFQKEIRVKKKKTVCQTNSSITLLPTSMAGFKHETRPDLFYGPHKD